MNYEINHNEITEIQLLDHTLELLDQKGAEAARTYLEANQQKVIATNRVQIQNYRYCLAAVCGKKTEALQILHSAIMEEGYWYRPEVFEDEDLQSLWDEPQFRQLKEISSKRYQEAQKNTIPVCTWNEKSADHIILALHGNQEAIEHAKLQWNCLTNDETQVEYLQSGELDSYGIYRWEADGPGAVQLSQTLRKIGWDNYHRKTLAGFSAGCNVITRAISEDNVQCNKIVLVAPWLPSFDAIGFEVLCEPLKDAKVLIICGAQDNDCLSGATALTQTLERHGIDCTFQLIPQLGHGFPKNLKEIVLSWIE